jgi:hypothetical protein
MGGMQKYTKFWLENPKGRDHSEELGVDRKKITEANFKVGGCGLAETGSG